MHARFAMSATHAHPVEEVRALERERDRIEKDLRSAPSPLVDELLRAERRWVVRRKRAIERTDVASRAVLHFRGATHTCIVRDVSPHGAGVDAAAQPRVGDEVCLVLTELGGAPALSAVVRHVTGLRVGLEFVPRSEVASGVAEELSRRFRVRGR